MIVSAYDKDDKIVEGKLSFTENGQRIVLTENGNVSLGRLHYIRFIEEEETEVDKQVKSDIDVIKKDLEAKKPNEEDLAKAGEERAKELADAGMKEKEPDEYKTKFVLQASAVAGAADAGVDVTKADANNSKALKGLTESEEIQGDTVVSEVHPDYQIAEPHQDNLTRDQIYLKMKQEISDYSKENNFDEKELVERMYVKFAGVRCLREQTLKESFKSIRSLAILREMTAQRFVKAVKDGDLKRVRNSFIKLHDQTFPDETRKEEYDPKDTLAFVDEVVTKLKEDGYSSAQIVEILGNWFGIGGTYEFDMDVIKKIIEDREEHDSILDAHPDWFPVNKENVWNNGTDVQKEFA